MIFFFRYHVSVSSYALVVTDQRPTFVQSEYHKLSINKMKNAKKEEKKKDDTVHTSRLMIDTRSIWRMIHYAWRKKGGRSRQVEYRLMGTLFFFSPFSHSHTSVYRTKLKVFLFIWIQRSHNLFLKFYHSHNAG